EKQMAPDIRKLLFASAALACVAISGCGYSAHKAANPPAAPNPPELKTLHVAQDGSADFTLIQAAINAAPETGALIVVAPGTYREVLTVDKPKIRLRGAGGDAEKIVVVFDRYAKANGGTSHTATVNVSGDDFVAENLTFQNDYQPAGNPYPEGSQAVALRVTGDRAIFENVRMLGHQDTLYAGSKGCMSASDVHSCKPARQYFSHCYIEGNFDFIFGDGKTVFDHCRIRSLPLVEGFITAQSKIFPDEDSGFVIYKSRLIAAPNVHNVWLGRPWRPYSTVTYIDTAMGAHINAGGWREWLPGKTNSIATATYSEFGSSGPGSHQAKRDLHTHILTAKEAGRYAPSVYLRGDDNWDPTRPTRPIP
ncbi:MAG: pectinesterase family protein, partial [Terracidiphilus sp.]